MNRKSPFIYIILLIFLTHCATTKPRPGLIIPEDMPPSAKIENVKVALVLGGGGSKGIAHVGVIDVLKENNIPIDLIVGSSAGSAVGAIYADNKNINKTKEILFKAERKELLDFSFMELMRTFYNPTAPVIGQAYENFIFDNISAKQFHELKIPLVVVTVDSQTGEKVIISSGPIAPAVRASSAVPPVIAPVLLYHRRLFDGGVVEPVPVITAKKYNPELIIAVDITGLPEKIEPNNSMELAYKAFSLSYYELSRLQASLADIDIHPDLSGYGMFEDHRKEELYELGKKAALAELPKIKKKLKAINYNRKQNLRMQ
jgi:NTE family protein